MKKIRYAFSKRQRPEWCEVPFDATDREAGAFDVCIASLPREKFNTLNYQLQSATAAYLIVKAELDEAENLANGRGRAPDEADVNEALGAIRESEAITPQLKRLLSEYIHGFARQRSEVEQALDSREVFLSSLRSIAPAGGDLGFSTLAFAETLADSDKANAGQLVSEAYESRLGEALSAMNRARAKIVSVGVTNHRGLIGQLVDDEGVPMVDAEGAQLEQEIPFEPGRWTWNGQPKKGVAPAGLDFYRAISPGQGLLVSLSEAVLLYQQGFNPTPDDVYKTVGVALPPSPKTPTPDEAPAVEQVSTSDDDPDPNVDAEGHEYPDKHPDDDEASPLV